MVATFRRDLDVTSISRATRSPMTTGMPVVLAPHLPRADLVHLRAVEAVKTASGRTRDAPTAQTRDEGSAPR